MLPKIECKNIAIFEQIRLHRIRFLKTVCLMLGAMMHGMHAGSTGPSLHDLTHQVQDDLSKVTLVTTTESMGYLVGSFASEF